MSLVLAAAAHAAVVETHQNEITQPVETYVTARVAALSALPAPTKAEKKELSALKKLAKTLAKTQSSLKGDFNELKAAAKTRVALGIAGAPMQAALDQAFARAQLSLSERIELGDDYAAAFLDTRRAQQTQKSLSKVVEQRAKAATATTDAKRASALAKTDTLLAAALKKADKLLVKAQGADDVPPTRFRSGDTLGVAGGRVAIPRDSGSPAAGASIVFPFGALGGPTVITLSEATGFVGGRDTPAGPAIAVSPDTLALGAPARVFLPFALPAGADPDDLAVFAAGPPAATLRPATANADGTLSASAASLSSFQAGVAAPPPGQPGGSYRLLMLISTVGLEAGGADAVDSGGFGVGVVDETITFRADLTGSTGSPTFQDVSRNFTRDGVHHIDSAQGIGSGSENLTWTADAPGRFSFTFPIGVGVQAQANGVVSDDARVIAFSGRGGVFEFLAVGVRGGSDVVAADLDGRWAAAEFGVELRNDLAEPFTTRWHSAIRWFTVSNGNVTFDAQGMRAEADVTYRTDQADPVHVLTESQAADGGTATWTVLPSGRFTEPMNRRIGWFDGDAGVIVSRSYDPAARSIALQVAVRQPAAATPDALPGLSRFAQYQVGLTAGSPTPRSSTHEPTPSTGTLDVASTTSATLSDDAATRHVCTLTGPVAAIGIDWTMTEASNALTAAQTPVTLSLDAAGNHLAPADPRWFAFSGDGKYVLTVVRGAGVRGMALGMK